MTRYPCFFVLTNRTDLISLAARATVVVRVFTVNFSLFMNPSLLIAPSFSIRRHTARRSPRTGEREVPFSRSPPVIKHKISSSYKAQGFKHVARNHGDFDGTTDLSVLDFIADIRRHRKRTHTASVLDRLYEIAVFYVLDKLFKRLVAALYHGRRHADDGLEFYPHGAGIARHGFVKLRSRLRAVQTPRKNAVFNEIRLPAFVPSSS